MKKLFVVAAIAASALTQPVSAQVITHNGTASPTCCAWGPEQVGWYYTPATNMTLFSVESRFGISGGYTQHLRPVTAEIRSSANGAVLATTTFATSSDVNQWVGGSFSPIELTGGSSYFLAFVNTGWVDGGYLGVNAVGGTPSEGFAQFNISSGGSMYATGEQFDPIVRFNGLEDASTVTPEPISMTLLGTGLAGVAAARRRRKAAAAA
jgi:hypothetical protein